MENGNGMNSVWKVVHPRTVIWALFVALIGVITLVGEGYASRLTKVEQRFEGVEKDLNGIQADTREIKVDLMWIKKTLEERRSP